MRAVAAMPEVLSPWRRRGLALLTSPSPRAGNLAGNLASNLAGNLAGNLEGDLAAMEGWSAVERWSARAIAPLVWALELGAAAFDMLHARLQGKRPRNRVLPVELVVRASTGPAPR